MGRQESDQEPSGDFINGRPVQVNANGKIRYLDEDDKPKSKNKPASRKGSRRRLYLRLAVLGVLGYLALKYVLVPFFETGGGNADTREVPGDATRFDPIANFASIKAYAGEGALLTEMDAYYVHSDGTLDLPADYYPRVSLKFVIPSATPADAPPIGAGGATDGQWYIPVDIDIYQPGQWRKVSSSSGSYSYVNKGMQRKVDDPTSSNQTILSDPTCSFADLWAEAIKHDAPQSAVAIIEYGVSGYRFSISDLSILLDFDLECQLIED